MNELIKSLSERLSNKIRDEKQNEIIKNSHIGNTHADQGPNYVAKELPKDLKKEYIDYYAKFGFKNVPLDWIEYIYSVKGVFDVGYIPDVIYHKYIDPYFPIKKYDTADKNIQQFIMNGLAKYPEMIVANIDGVFVDSGYNVVSELSAMKIVSDYLDSISSEDSLNCGVIIKPSVYNGAGYKVSLLENADDILVEFRRHYVRDFVVQKRIKQDPVIASLNPDSINTVRILTFFYKGEVHILSSFIRIGSPGSCIDNITGHADHYRVGILPDGRLDEIGYNIFSETRTETLSGKPFREYKIEQYPQMVEVAKAGHRRMLKHKVVGWDFAVDKNGEIIMIEYNYKGFSLIDYEMVSGPLFGDMLDDILEDAAGKKRPE